MDKQCTKCGKIKSENEFYKTQRGSNCKECILEQTRNYKRNRRKDDNFKLIESLKQKERRVRLWQNTLIHDSKFRGIENELTVEDINDMYKNQNGLCFWFKIPLIPSKCKKHPQQPSIDRIDRNKGYFRNNVVLCCYAANIGRNENDVEIWIEFLKLFIKDS